MSVKLFAVKNTLPKPLWGGLYSFLQTGGLGFFIAYHIFRVSKEVKEHIREAKISCPVCMDHGVLSELKLKEYKRCSKCTKKCGYQRRCFLTHWEFCSSCNGDGYF